MRKEVLRNVVRQRRFSITPEERIKAEKAIFERFKELDEWQDANAIASYNPLPEEASVSLINNFLLEQGKSVYLPEVILNGDNIKYHKWQFGSVMKSDWCGIDYPLGKVIPTEEIDLFIVPLFGFDRFCNRLGTGGGFFDRFFTINPFKESVIKLGIAFSVQEVSMMITDKWDVKMDMIVTEKEVIRG